MRIVVFTHYWKVCLSHESSEDGTDGDHDTIGPARTPKVDMEGTLAQTNWMLVSGPDNFERARETGFPVLAMKSRHRKKAERVQPGDRVLFYATGVQAFAGTFTVKSTYFESHEPIFQSKKAGEDYPFRFEVQPDVVAAPGGYVPVAEILPQLEYVKKWPPQHWHLAFQGNVHVLSEQDFATVEESLRRVATPANV